MNGSGTEGDRKKDDSAVGAPAPPNAAVAGNGSDRTEQALPAGDLGADTNGATKEITKPLRRDGEDANGFKIQNVYCSTRLFFIYEADNQVRFKLPDDYEVARELRRKVADLGGLRTSIEDLRAEPSLSQNEKIRAAREISWALAQAFEDESSPPSEKPKEILTRVDARLRSLVKSHYRKKYVLANLAAFGAIEVILILLAIGFAHWWNVPESLGALHRYAIYGACGALGALLSVITGIRSIDVDINLKKWEHIFAGATRILIGVVGALVIGLALDSKFIDPTLGSADLIADTAKGSLERKLALYLLFAFIGGFSESLVPNLLRKGEQAAGGSEGQSTPNDPIVKSMKPCHAIIEAKECLILMEIFLSRKKLVMIFLAPLKVLYN